MKDEERKALWQKYKPLERIPREWISALEKKLKSEYAKVEIAGSYRRGKPFLGDVDILCTKNPIESIPGEKVIISQGPQRTEMLLHYKKTWIKVDIFVTKREYWGAFLLYLTGSKEHNIHMRRESLKKGLTLNQYGLYRGDVLVSSTEMGIFKELGLKYIDPTLR